MRGSLFVRGNEICVCNSRVFSQLLPIFDYIKPLGVVVRLLAPVCVAA